MSHNYSKVLPLEKIISILSYISMGIIGVFWIIFAYCLKKHIRFFLMYNINQSIIISITLAIIKLALDLILPILAVIPILNYISAIFNYLISIKLIRLYPLGISFTILELAVFLILAYICAGVLTGRIFYVPVLTNLMQKIMKNYDWDCL